MSSPAHDVALLLKSYAPDFAYAQRLVASFNKYNIEHLTMYVLVPPTDVPLFDTLAGDYVQVLDESLLAHHLVDKKTGGMRPGYINQEIIKRLAYNPEQQVTLNWNLVMTFKYLHNCIEKILKIQEIIFLPI